MFDDSSAAAIETALLGMLHTILEGGFARPEDTFTELGAGSLLVIQLYALIEQHAPGRVTLQDVFDHRSVRALAAWMFGRNGNRAAAAARPVEAIEL